MLIALKAEWVLPVTGNPLPHACVILNDNIIENVVTAENLNQAVGDRTCQIQDYGRCIITPGLINLHTHLEHTRLKHLAKESEFLDWLPNLMKATANWSFEDRLNSAEEGLAQSINAGTTFIVDSSYNGASIKPLAISGLRALIGLEIFGIDEQNANSEWQLWLERRNNLVADQVVEDAIKKNRLAVTVSPHAPYTVSPALWHHAKLWAQTNNLTLLTHLAESPQEYAWFQTEDNNLKQFLINAFAKRLPNIAHSYEEYTRWKSRGKSPIEHLHINNLLSDNLLAAHVVNLNNNDIELLRTKKVSIAHCPNSNTILRCGKTPLNQLLRRNLPVGLGTDSAASSNNLNMLAEAAFAIKLHNYNNGFVLSAKDALELITIKAARCLKIEHQLGSLENGKLADIAIFSLPKKSHGKDLEDPCQLLLSGACQLQQLLVNGKIIK